MRALRKKATLLALLALTVSAAPLDAAVLKPQPFVAEFALEARGFTVGETVWRLECDDSGFIYESRTEAVGFAAVFSDKRVVERSEWKHNGNELKPASYRYERSGRPDKTTSVVFRWNDGVVQNTRRGETSRMAVPDDTLDKLGYMLVLMQDLRSGKRSVRYNIADGKNRVKVYQLSVVGEERMETPFGTLDVLKLVRERKDDDRETTIWVAPSLDYMPVRIEHRERDDGELTIRIRSLSRAPAAEKPDAGGGEPKNPSGPFN